VTAADRSRRSLLQGLVLAVGGGQARRALAGPLGSRRADSGPRLAAADLDDVIAFGEVLVAGGRLPDAERRVLLDHVRDRLASGDRYFAGLYPTTARLLARLAGTRFSSLGIERRLALVTQHRLGLQVVAAGEALGDDARAVRTRAVPDLIAGYYASAAGWGIVGYRAFPGRCGDLDRYTRPEA